MTQATGSDERRKDRRYRLPKAIVSMPQRSMLAIGTAVDISKGGLAVRYPDRGEQLAPSFEVDILLTETNCFMTSFPVVLISDFGLENQVPVSLVNERRCGLKFGKLTTSQASQLKQVLTTLTDPIEPLSVAR